MKPYLVSLIVFLFSAGAFAVAPKMAMSGHLTKPDGTSLTSSNVGFKFSVANPAGSCILFSETHSALDLSASNGNFELQLGAGLKTFPLSAVGLKDIFANTGSLNCDPTGSYLPSVDDGRVLYVQFIDQNESTPTWRSFTSTVPISSVAYAVAAESAAKLGNNIATDFLTKVGLPTCVIGQFLTWDGSAMTCVAAVTGTGTVTSVTGTLPISVVGTTTPVISMSQANSTTDGYLTSANWLAFNAKMSNTLTSANFWVGNASGVATAVTMSGDASMLNTGAVSLSTTGVVAGSYAKVSVDAKGRVLAGLSMTTADITTALGFTPSNATAAFINGGNNFGAAASIGTGDAFGLNLAVNGSPKLSILLNGNVGIGTTSPSTALNVNGAIVSNSIANTVDFIDFTKANVQMSSTSASAINICGLKDGGSYTLVLTGVAPGTTVTINAFPTYVNTTSCSGTPMGVDLSGGVATFTSSGNTNILSFVYFSARGANGTVYGFPATNYGL